jgi:hypothetical protein
MNGEGDQATQGQQWKREREGVATSPRKKKRLFFEKGNDPILCIKVMHTTFFIKFLLKSTYYKSLISQS